MWSPSAPVLPAGAGADEVPLGIVLVLGTIPAGARSRPSAGPPQGSTRDHPRGCEEQGPSSRNATVAAGPSPRVRGAGPGRTAGSPRRGTTPAGAGSRGTCWSPVPGRRDHPRGCGEQGVRGGRARLAEGPSPRVRGAVVPPEHRPDHLGTIPAGAGSSRGPPAARPPRRDHPRGCGEQQLKESTGSNRPGPSPRVRGAEPAALADPDVTGTIPAGAGSSRRQGVERVRDRDHPRGCGEQGSSQSVQVSGTGPSPRVRGAVGGAAVTGHRIGTIPAGAGSSETSAHSRRRPRDHPRGCGEQSRSPGTADPSRGPSPRVRGADRGLQPRVRAVGTIPAGAGSRPAARTPRTGQRDHPRGCGEQELVQLGAQLGEGPSPRVRGADEGERVFGLVVGTIPAGAGSSLPAQETSECRRDHPRGCGEQPTDREPSMTAPGPSPRVRGAGLGRAHERAHVGTIPAGAGSREGARHPGRGK